MASRASLGKFFDFGKPSAVLPSRGIYCTCLAGQDSEVIWTAHTEDVIRHALLSSASDPELPSVGIQLQQCK